MMTPHRLLAALALIGVLAPAAAHAQHEASAAPASQAPTPLTGCAQAQPAVENIIAAASARLESARQSNDPVQMRAAVDDLQAVLRDLRTMLAPCATPGATADPHAGHAMPAAPKPAASPDPHAGHTMPGAKPAAPGTQFPGKKAAPPTSAPKPAKPADPHAGHTMPSPAKPGQPPSKPAPESKEANDTIDPVCGMTVDPGKALSTTYKGKTYHFCSAEDRLRFIRNPETYLKKKESAK